MSSVTRFCARCSRPHSTDSGCPKKVAWDKTGRSSGRGGRVWRDKIRPRIFKRDAFLCQIHLARGLEVPVELSGHNHGVCDHIVPLEEGGTDRDSNLQTICQECDKIKTQEESLRGRGVLKS